jgi:peptidoglycan hydrolase FlgJ
MQISALKPHVNAADLPIEKLASNPNVSDSEKVGQACRQFEAVFLRQIFQEARKTVISSSTNQNSSISGIYDDMVNNQLADGISSSGAFGLAKSLQAQLVHQVLPGATEHGASGHTSLNPNATRTAGSNHHISGLVAPDRRPGGHFSAKHNVGRTAAPRHSIGGGAATKHGAGEAAATKPNAGLPVPRAHKISQP